MITWMLCCLGAGAANFPGLAMPLAQTVAAQAALIGLPEVHEPVAPETMPCYLTPISKMFHLITRRGWQSIGFI